MGRRKQSEQSTGSQKNVSPIERRYRKRIALIGAVGGVIAVLGWMAQNIPQQSPDLERYAQWEQDEISKEQIWLIEYQKARRAPKPDPELLLNYANNWAKVVKQVIDTAAAAVPHSSELQRHAREFHKMNNELQQIIATRPQVRDPEVIKKHLISLQDSVGRLMEWFGRVGPEAHEALGVEYNSVRVREGRAQLIYQGLFLLGALTTACAWYIEHFKIPGGLWAKQKA
jgi:hypothetical protein